MFRAAGMFPAAVPAADAPGTGGAGGGVRGARNPAAWRIEVFTSESDLWSQVVTGRADQPVLPLVSGTEEWGSVESLDARWYATLFERSWLPMARLDPAGRILDSNAAFSTLTGRSSRELRGLPGGELLTPGDAGADPDSWAGLFAGRRARYQGRVLVVRKDRRLLYAEANAWLVRDGRQPPAEAVCSLRPVLAAEEAEFLSSAAPLHLSELEARTLEGLAEGMTNSALSRALSLSRQGLDYHLAQLRGKLRARSRCALVARAYALGVVTPGVWPPRVDPSAVDRPRVPRRRRPGTP